ncbi:MAG: replication associated protein [Wigfec virus K19_513]|nr:MAG: replication associated protein [Wigfec virus K19_513]
MTSQWQGWCLTHYGASEKLHDMFTTGVNAGTIKYGIYQLELCPSTQKEHQQAWIYLNKKKTFGGIRKICIKAGLTSPHIERQRGTNDEARKYCMKEASRKPDSLPMEYGEVPNERGEQNVLKPMWKAIKDGKTKKEIMTEFPEEYSRYRNGVNDLLTSRDHGEGKQRKMPIVIVIWGDTGTGKSHLAHDIMMSETVPFMMVQGGEPPAGGVSVTGVSQKYASATYEGIYLNGYNGEKKMIINEFTGQIPLEKLLQICDKWPYTVNIKGGSTPMNAELIVLTSPIHPKFWYDPNIEKGQLARRINKTIELKKIQIERNDTWNDVVQTNSSA